MTPKWHKTTASLAAAGWLMGLAGSAALAGGYITDSFGVLPAAEMRGAARADWAGMQQQITPGGGTIRLQRIVPGPAETLILFAGPKGPVAGQDTIHAIAVVLDAKGNLVADDSAVRVSFVPGAPRDTATRFGMAGVLVQAGARAGQIHVGAASGGRQSPRDSIHVAPDIDSMQPALEPPDTAFPREAFVQVATGPLADVFGNAVGQGVAVQLLGRMQDGGQVLANGVTNADRAGIQVLTRSFASTGQVQASLARRTSAPVTIRTRQLVAPVPPQVEASALDAIGALDLRIGPFLSDAGYLLNDGTEVTVAASFDDGRQINLTGWLRDGYLGAMVPGDAGALPAEFRITAETGRFHQRLERLAKTPNPDRPEAE